MRQLLLSIFGLKTYVTNLQIANERLAFDNERLAGERLQLRLQLDEQQKNSKDLHAYNNELNNQVDKLNDLVTRHKADYNAIASRCTDLEERNDMLVDENKKLSEMCNDYNAQCAKLSNSLSELRWQLAEVEETCKDYEKKLELSNSKRNSLAGTISSLKRKLAKYEAQAD